MYNKMTCLLLLAFTCSLAAVHDHSQHLDTNWILHESKRLAWLTKEDLSMQITDFATALGKLEDKYDAIMSNRRLDSEQRWIDKL